MNDRDGDDNRVTIFVIVNGPMYGRRCGEGLRVVTSETTTVDLVARSYVNSHVKGHETLGQPAVTQKGGKPWSQSPRAVLRT